MFNNSHVQRSAGRLRLAGGHYLTKETQKHKPGLAVLLGLCACCSDAVSRSCYAVCTHAMYTGDGIYTYNQGDGWANPGRFQVPLLPMHGEKK